MAIEESSIWYRTNHLLFIDDLKLFAKIKEGLQAMVASTTAFLQGIGLSVNPSKSVTSIADLGSVARYLEENKGYDSGNTRGQPEPDHPRDRGKDNLGDISRTQDSVHET